MTNKGWSIATIQELANYVSRGRSPRYVSFSDMSVINQRCIRWSGVDDRFIKYIDPKTFHQWNDERILIDGDILWNSTGTGTIGRAAIFRPIKHHSRIVADSHVTIVRLHSDISAEYLFNYIRSPHIQNAILDMQSGSTNQVELNRSAVLETVVPLAPAAEQRRIVAKLDALSARLTRARAELDRVVALARHLRTSMLDKCYTGHTGREIALDALLDSIEAGKNLRCDERRPRKGEKGVVKVSAVTWGEFDPTQAKTLPIDYKPSDKAHIKKGDLLISRANTLELVGAVVIVEEEANDLYLSDKILRLVMNESYKRWVMWFLRSPAGRQQIESKATGNQLSMRNISQAALGSIQIPFPDEEERHDRVHALEQTFARADRLEAEAARARALLDRLEATILAKAFRGELVPQDPNDEPASVLLDRIRAQRAAVPKAKRGGRKAVADA